MEGASTNHQPVAPSAPLSSWPGAFGAFNPAREAVRRNLSTIVMLLLLSVTAAVLVDIIFGRVIWLNELVGGIVSAVFTAAEIYAFIGSVRGRHVELGSTFSEALPIFFKIFALNLLVGVSVVGGVLPFVLGLALLSHLAVAGYIMVAIGAIFFIAWVIIVLPRLVLAPYFLIDKKMGIIEAYKTSWHVTKGHSRQVWAIIGVTALMILPCITVVGVIATVYLIVMYSTVTALFYQFILDHPQPKPTPQ